MKQVLLEDIITFQSIEAFEESAGLIYEDLTDHELFRALEQWHYPGEHDTNWYNEDYVDTNFLGHTHEVNGEQFLLNRHEKGLLIGLGRIIDTREV